jgi:hypothetical protein
MIDVKPWWASKAVWGGVVAMLAGAAGLWGYKVSPADQAQLVELVSSAVALAGGAYSVYGRIVATKKVG